MLAAFFGRKAFRLVGKYRDIAVNNLCLALGGSREDNMRIAERVFENVAKNGAEWVKLSLLDPENLGDMVTEFHGAEHLDGVLSEGKGAIIVAAHFGNWELLGIYLRNIGYKGTMIVRRLYFHKYDDFITNLRLRYNVHGIYRDSSPKAMLRVLKKGEVLGILADQDIDSVDGTFVDFFGRPSFTPTAPVKLAMATGAKLVPAFVIRKKDNTHKIVIEKPIDVGALRNDEEAVKRYTQEWTNVLERYVKAYPDQWVWMHRRWKTEVKK